ncbi:MAG: ATP-binding protein [Chloroflexota bacterium]
MKLKISIRITLWFLIATACVTVVSDIAVYKLFGIQLDYALKSELKDYGSLLTSGLAGESGTLADVFEKILRKKEKTKHRSLQHYFALASDDSVIYEEGTLANIDSLLDEYSDKHEFSYKSAFNTITISKRSYLSYSLPIKDKRGAAYNLLLFASLEHSRELLAQLQKTLIIISALSIAIFGFIGYFIARKSMEPVHKITLTAAKISSLKLNLRAPTGPIKDELSELAETFNSMLDRLDANNKAQKQFIADISHDIRTPLTALQLELERLRLALPPERAASADQSLIELNNLQRLTESLIVLARADFDLLEPKLELVRLEEIVFESLNSVKLIADLKNIRFDLDVTEPIETRSDPGMLQRIFTNALDNAVKYSPPGSVIAIILTIGESGIRAIVRNPIDPLQPPDVNTAFSRFTRGDKSRSTQGFGLGLSIIRTLIEKLGGQVQIEIITENSQKFLSLDAFLPIL